MLKFYGEFTVGCFKRWQRYRENGKSFEIYKEINAFTMRTMSLALFNYELTDTELEKFAHAFKYILEFVQNREMSLLNLPLFIPTTAHSEFRNNLNFFRELVVELIAKDQGHVYETGKIF